MKKNNPKTPFTIMFGGTLGNFVFKLEHKMGCNHRTSEQIKEIQKDVFNFCDLGSLYFTNELLKKNNNHHLDKLNVNLKKFVEDTEYYFHIFEHNKSVYDIIIDWFGKHMSEFWKELNDYLFMNVDNSSLHLFWDVMTYGLNYYPYNEIGEEDKLRDTLKCMEKDTDWDCEKGIKDVHSRVDGFKNDVLKKELHINQMEVV